MATNPASRPKGRSIKSLRTVWGFALHYPGHIAVAALALLVAFGHAPEVAAEAVSAFTGVLRRFTLAGQAGGVID